MNKKKTTQNANGNTFILPLIYINKHNNFNGGGYVLYKLLKH